MPQFFAMTLVDSEMTSFGQASAIQESPQPSADPHDNWASFLGVTHLRLGIESPGGLEETGTHPWKSNGNHMMKELLPIVTAHAC
jgi:hypothetical protein